MNFNFTVVFNTFPTEVLSVCIVVFFINPLNNDTSGGGHELLTVWRNILSLKSKLTSPLFIPVTTETKLLFAGEETSSDGGVTGTGLIDP